MPSAVWMREEARTFEGQVERAAGLLEGALGEVDHRLLGGGGHPELAQRCVGRQRRGRPILEDEHFGKRRESPSRSCLNPTVWAFARLLVTSSIRRIDVEHARGGGVQSSNHRSPLGLRRPAGTRPGRVRSRPSQPRAGPAAIGPRAAQPEQAGGRRGRRTDRHVAAGVREHARAAPPLAARSRSARRSSGLSLGADGVAPFASTLSTIRSQGFSGIGCRSTVSTLATPPSTDRHRA